MRENVRLLEALLTARGYEVLSAADGAAALELVRSAAPDLVLLDVQMPPPDGYEVCQLIRADPRTSMLPVVMLTAELGAEKTRGLEAGADDFIAKPFEPDELFARVQSLLRIKRYHDELAELNRTLEERVQSQVAELERMRRLERFLSPQLAESIVHSGDESILKSHRREVAMLFADLRGWTNFVDAVEPEELMRVLGEFHATIGRLVGQFDATVGFLEGDGVQLFFNDPIPIPDAPLRAVRLACALRDELEQLTPVWRKRGHDLGLGIGAALGYATCGQVGFEARSDYAAIGSVTNLASRLSDAAKAGQILISQRLYAEVENEFEVEAMGDLTLAGFQRPVAAYNVTGSAHRRASQRRLARNVRRGSRSRARRRHAAGCCRSRPWRGCRRCRRPSPAARTQNADQSRQLRFGPPHLARPAPISCSPGREIVGR